MDAAGSPPSERQLAPRRMQSSSSYPESVPTSNRRRHNRQMTAWLLVHSPLIGPNTWNGVARALARNGDSVFVPDLRPTLSSGPPFAEPQAEIAAAAADMDEVVLVVHSGAGALVPLIARRLGRHLRSVVFLDAGLPIPGRARLNTFSGEAIADLHALLEDGYLPPWPGWWPPELLAELLPDPRERTALEADSLPIPFALLSEVMPAVADFEKPSTFIRLSAAYDAEADRAEALGWPVQRQDSDHLAPISAPGNVAAWLTQSIRSLRQ
jgi:hypothetical protein